MGEGGVVGKVTCTKREMKEQEVGGEGKINRDLTVCVPES